MNRDWIAHSALALAVVVPQAQTLTFPETSLRRLAVTPVAPEYPASSVKAGASGSPSPMSSQRKPASCNQWRSSRRRIRRSPMRFARR